MPSGLSSVDLYTSSVEPTLTGENTHTHTTQIRKSVPCKAHAASSKPKETELQIRNGKGNQQAQSYQSLFFCLPATCQDNKQYQKRPPSLPPYLHHLHYAQKTKKTRLIGLVSVHDLPEMLKPVGRHAIVEDGVRVGQHVATTEPVLATLERRTSRDAW